MKHLYHLRASAQARRWNGYNYTWRNTVDLQKIDVEVTAANNIEAEAEAIKLLPSLQRDCRWSFAVVRIGQISITYQEA